jgi:hypothetical protein
MYRQKKERKLSWFERIYWVERRNDNNWKNKGMNSFLVWALSFAIIIAIVRFNFNHTPSSSLLFGSLLIAFWIIKIKFHRRRFGGSCLNLNNPKVEDNSADANNPIPPHLVIMVNGIVGR